MVKTYRVSVGAEHTPSPEGIFTILRKVKDPIYSYRGKVVQPGKDNPVGTRWVGLNRKGYGIHGTNAPRSIGKAASHGCIRMGKHDLEEFFTMVRVGDTVVIRAEADDQTAEIFGTKTNTVLAQAPSAAAGGQ